MRVRVTCGGVNPWGLSADNAIDHAHKVHVAVGYICTFVRVGVRISVRARVRVGVRVGVRVRGSVRVRVGHR